MPVERKSLKDVVAVVSEKAVVNKRADWPYLGLEHLATGEPRLLGQARSDTSVSVNSVFQAGDILFGKLRPNLRKTVQAAFSGYCSTDILVFRAQNGMYPGYAARLFQREAVAAAAVASAEGTKMPRTSWARLSEETVFVPPLPEQRRIAAILDTLDRTIEGTQRVIEKLQATRQGLLHDLLTRGLDENGGLRDPERNPEQFKETELGRVPGAWRELRLSNISTHITKGATPTTFGRKWADSGVLFLRSECVKDNEFSLSGAEFIDVVTHKLMGRSVVVPGDILMTITGYIGRSCMYPTGLGDANINQHIARVRVVHPDALPKFVAWQLQDIRQKSRLERDLTGLAYPQISLEQVRDIPVFLPRLDEQKRISSALDAAKRQVAEEEERLAKLQALKRGLMEDLLTGRVRVPVRGVEEGQASRTVRPDTEVLPQPNVPLLPPPMPVAAQPRALYRAGAGANPQAMTEWTQQLQEAVRGQQVGTYSHAALDAVLPELLALSADRGALLRVPELLARAGIRFMLLPHPKGSRTSGAAFYLDEPERTQPVVGLSLLNPYLDVFWFNLLHELGHIRLGHEPVPDESLEQGEYDPNSTDEQAANTFARNWLIPEAKWQPFLAAQLHDSNRVKRFAGKLSRHPAIVAGRLGRETGNWQRFNLPKLRPTVRAELDELMAQLRSTR